MDVRPRVKRLQNNNFPVSWTLMASALLGLLLIQDPVAFTLRSAKDGPWSDPSTWTEGCTPRAGDLVQVRHRVLYDAASDDPIRMIHVAGTLEFSRTVSTRLVVGLLKIQPGDSAIEHGFTCGDKAPGDGPMPALLVGTPEDPIPAGVTAEIRLTLFPGTDADSLPAIVACRGRWEIHGAPLGRPWLKLDRTAKAGDADVLLAEAPAGWAPGDELIVTASHSETKERQTEERRIAKIVGRTLTLDRPLTFEHFGEGEMRSEAALLSRNVRVVSGDGPRGHTMYHRGSAGSISHAEFRRLGKKGVLGRYPIHFHLARDTMRGSSVVGAVIRESDNRFLTIHATDYLVVRDCIGYKSVGHGFFLEDATEQHNLLDRNLAVQAADAPRLPKQVLPFDPNDGAGFWWANGRNSLVRNVSCENETYGFRFDIARSSGFDPVLPLRGPDGTEAPRDVRTVPFTRFEQNEAHSEGLYSFRFGEDRAGVAGDERHPFIARNLLTWETHYALRPNVRCFLMDGLRIVRAAYGVYHPDYDAHVYRDISMTLVNAEPVNRGHDDESVQDGAFTYENLVLEQCRLGRDPLIQMACTSPRADQAGHFRGLTIRESRSRGANVVDLGGGPRNDRLQHPVTYYFHEPDRVTAVTSRRFPGEGAAVEGFTGPDVRARDAGAVAFPKLLDPVDDQPPATIITSVRRSGDRLRLRGVAHDNGEITAVEVDGKAATILSRAAGVVEWEIEVPAAAAVTAASTDAAGNHEKTPHVHAAP